MARSFDFSVESSVGVEQIHSAFSEEGYWLARLAAFGGVGRLDSFVVDADGSVHVVTIQDLRNALLPGLFAKLYPRDLAIVQAETWSLIGSGLVCGKVSTTARGAPGSGLGTVSLAEAKDGSRLKCTATAEIKVPFVGARLESYVGHQMVEETPVMLGFTARWIAEHS
jgi:hypothetical protein